MESFMGDLSACETMIMKVILDAKEDIALQSTDAGPGLNLSRRLL